MSNTRVDIDGLADAVMEGLTEYAELATDSMKDAVTKAAKTCKSEIAANAPKHTGKYAKSWTTKVTKENSNTKEITVYSKKPGLPHLLEHGHAKVGGGRVTGHAHIAPAEEKAEKQLEQDIKKALEG